MHRDDVLLEDIDILRIIWSFLNEPMAGIEFASCLEWEGEYFCL
jgi:hypothetical protein